MGIRQTLNRNPVLSGVAAAMIVVLVLAAQLRRGGAGRERVPPPPGEAKQFFTVDDGKNWFVDDAARVPPFKHEGKDAYRVIVYRCPDGDTFPARLERFAEPARKRLQDAVDRARARGEAIESATAGLNPEMEVKRPGQREWVRYTPKTMKEYAAVMEVQCPDGSHEVEQVFPD